MKMLLLIISAFHLVVSCHGFIATTTTRRHDANRRMTLQMSLKPAAIPLMDAGKALARSGELLVNCWLILQIKNHSTITVVGCQQREP